MNFSVPLPLCHIPAAPHSKWSPLPGQFLGEGGSCKLPGEGPLAGCKEPCKMGGKTRGASGGISP